MCPRDLHLVSVTVCRPLLIQNNLLKLIQHLFQLMLYYSSCKTVWFYQKGCVASHTASTEASGVEKEKPIEQATDTFGSVVVRKDSKCFNSGYNTEHQ